MEYETISELIIRLQKARDEYGDHPVILTAAYGATGSIFEISYGSLPFELCECFILNTDICSG